MNKGGSVVRLIDVVLILLLGFLQVSDVVHKKQIKLPGKTGSKQLKNKEDKILPLEIRVMQGDTVMAEIDPATETSLKIQGQLHCYYIIRENKEVYRIRMIDKLEQQLLTTKASYDSIAVIVNPDPNSIIQGTINLIDICRKYELKRKFKYIEGKDEI